MYLILNLILMMLITIKIFYVNNNFQFVKIRFARQHQVHQQTDRIQRELPLGAVLHKTLM